MKGLSRISGATIQGDAHLMQSLRDIINTPIGSRVMRRDYGSLVPFIIDQPGNAYTLQQLRASIIHAILRWEKRVTPKSVKLSITSDGQSTLDIEYQRVNGTMGHEQLQLGAAA